MDGIPLEHPLALELQSLRASVLQFQEEAHQSSVKLQRHSLDSTRAHERAVYHERENDVLKAEIAILRANPLSSAQTNANAESQVQELTLSLRRLSQKLGLMEESLLATQTQLVLAQTESKNAKENANNAYELGARVRGREEEGLARERALEMKVRKLEQELKMSDGVVKEYAALVRDMQARSSSHDHDAPSLPTNTNLAEFLKSKENDLENLFDEFQATSHSTLQKVDALTHELEITKSRLVAEQKSNLSLINDLAKIKTELEKLKLDDGTAAKMVARYMQFSQTSTNKLLDTVANLQARHSGTLHTLSSQNHALSTRLRSLEAQNASTLRALDDLGGEIMKESYGRRKEVMLRIKMNGREERIAEGLRRWVRRGDELVRRLRESSSEESEEHSSLLDMAQHARILLESLESGVLDERTAISLSGAKARHLLAHASLERLFDELRDEKAMRIALEKELAMQAGWPEEDVLRPLESEMIEEHPIFSANVDAPLPPTPIEEETSPVDDSCFVSSDAEIDIPTDELDVSNVNAQETTKEPLPSETKVAVELPEEPVYCPPSNVSITFSSKTTEITTVTQSLPLSVEATILSAQSDIPVVSSPRLTSEDDASNLHGDIVGQIDPQAKIILEEGPIIDLETTSMAPASLSPDEVVAPIAQPQLDKPVMEVLSFEDNVSLVPALSPPSSTMSRTATPLLDTPPLLEPPTESSRDEKMISVNSSYDSNPISSSPSPLLSPLSTPSTTKADLPIHSGNEDPVSVPAQRTTEVKEESEGEGSSSAEHIPASQPSPSRHSLSLPPPSPSPSLPKPKSEPHPLLANLARVNQRYDQLQKSFRDCHIALEGLKHELGSTENSGSLPSSSSAYGGLGRGHPSSSVHFSSSLSNGSGNEHTSNSLPVEVLRAALARLDDYTEDARVELEIRIGDEEMTVKGWEALLSVPGALISDKKGRNSENQEDDEDHLVPFQTEVEEQIKAFISGDDPAIKKARDGFERKLEDVLHDIAILKRVVHDPASLDISSNSGTSTDELSSLASNLNLSVHDANGESISPSGPSMALLNPTSSSGWTSWIRSPSLVSSRPSGPAPTPTFGSIMTTPRSPLRHSSSNVSLRSAASQDHHPPLPPNHQRPRKGSFFGFSLPLSAGGGTEQEKSHNPLSQLGLRVPMPNFSTISGNGSPMTSPSPATSPLTPGIGSARTRTVSSTMYMLGLGQGAKSPGISMGNSLGLSRSVSAGGPSAYGSLKFPRQTPMRMNRQVSEPMAAFIPISSGFGIMAEGTNGAVGVEEVTDDEDEDESSERDDNDNDTDVE